MRLFAIRHVATQTFMPETHGHYTKWEPTTIKDRWGGEIRPMPPRMFLTENKAKLAAAAWVRGIYKTSTKSDSDGYEYPSYDYQTEPQIHAPKIPRSKGDLVVVPFDLFEAVAL